jgi:hypothetical protein
LGSGNESQRRGHFIRQLLIAAAAPRRATSSVALSERRAAVSGGLTRFCEQLAYLAQRLAETPEPGGGGNLPDNTLIVYRVVRGCAYRKKIVIIPRSFPKRGLSFPAHVRTREATCCSQTLGQPRLG